MNLAQVQQAVLAGLTRGSPLPASFAADGMERAARVLRHKRLRALVACCPSLASPAARHFHAYGASVPLPLTGGPLADARQFMRWLAKRGEADATVLREALLIDLRFATTPAGLRPRARLGATFTLRRIGSSWWLGARLPGIGPRIAPLRPHLKRNA